MKVERKAAQQISRANHILAACHVSPDGDAIGSLLGLGLGLGRIGKQVMLVCADPVPEQSRHLPCWELIVPLDPDGIEKVFQAARSRAFDLFVSLDCSDLARLGKAYNASLLANVPIINIDHHATNVGFGKINWIEPTAASTTQLVARLLTAMRISFTPDIATCLLNGLVTDTLGFRTSNTTTAVLETAVQLMNAGASLSELSDRIFNHRPLGTILMWSHTLQNLHLDGRILWSEITQTMRQRTGYQENGDAGLVNFINTAEEADIAVIFDELTDGRINVSMRATPGYDVSQVALALGGGGHAQAAGCTLPGPLEAARTRTLDMLRQLQADPAMQR